ncbi:transmembrane protein 100-like [Pelodytes ibericus]
MAAAFSPQKITVELNDPDPTLTSYGNEPNENIMKDPHLISTTTGGMENSCHNCMLGLGIIAFLIGVSATSVAVAAETIDFVLFVLGLSVIIIGISSVVFSCVWRVYRKKQKAKRNEDLAILFYESKEKKIRI